MRTRHWISMLLWIIASALPAAALEQVEYRLLATKKTSTMQKEMSEAAAEGFRFIAVMGGETSFGGSEVVMIMAREWNAPRTGRFRYHLLATSKTSTMQKELQQMGDEGFDFRGQTVFKTTFGGQEVVVILERDREKPEPPPYEYRLLATKKTSTLQRELDEVARDGFMVEALTVGETSFGGSELVVILKRPRG